MVLARLRRGAQKARVYRRPRVRITFSDFVDIMAITYYRGAAEKLVRAFELDKNIKRAGLNYFPQMYAARLLLYTTVSAALALYFMLLLAFTAIPTIIKVIIALFLAMTPLLVFAIGLSYPSMKSNERGNGVETELPFFAAYLTTMARGGVPVSKVMERVAKLRIFKSMREEAQRIVRDISIFGRDPLEALEANALEHPSSTYRDFILGYVTSVRTGGDVLHYLEIRTQDIFTRRIASLRLIAERMSMFTEVYVTIAVIMTLVFYIFFTINAIFPAGGFGGVAGLALFSFVLLPTLTILILYMIHSSQPKSPIAIKSPYRALFSWGVPLAIAVFPFLFFLTGADRVLGGQLDKGSIIGLTATLALTLAALSLPPASTYLVEKRKLKGINRATASFLRDLAEIRKTGLSPEKSIILAASRDYGPLNRILRRVATALSLGLDVERALKRALRGVKSWILLANMRFLSDSITVGGGSPETLDSLARYAHNLVEIEEELVKRLRSYIFMPYMGAILVAASSLLILGLTVDAVAGTGGATLGVQASITPQDIAETALLLSLGAVFNAWLMGLVAGKIQDAHLAMGFFHSIILVLVTLATTVVTLNSIDLAFQQAQQTPA